MGFQPDCHRLEQSRKVLLVLHRTHIARNWSSRKHNGDSFYILCESAAHIPFFVQVYSEYVLLQGCSFGEDFLTGRFWP